MTLVIHRDLRAELSSRVRKRTSTRKPCHRSQGQPAPSTTTGTLATILASRLSDSTPSRPSMQNRSKTRPVTLPRSSPTNHTVPETTFFPRSRYRRPHRRRLCTPPAEDSRSYRRSITAGALMKVLARRTVRSCPRRPICNRRRALL